MDAASSIFRRNVGVNVLQVEIEDDVIEKDVSFKAKIIIGM